MQSRALRITIAAMSLLTLTACESMYFKSMEKIGVHKRDILVDRVEDARDAQTEGKAQFQSALEEFSHVVNFTGGDLEDTYNKLNGEYEDAEEAAQEVKDRIDAVESVAEALFSEWRKEIDQYTSAKLKRSSERKLRTTRSKYRQMLASMRKAESKMRPVLSAFKDQVLYLKHNLNARAITSLQEEFGSIKTNIAVLIKEMEKSIDEAEAFIQTMEQE